MRSSGGIEADGQAFDAEDDEAVLGLEVGFGYAVQVREAVSAVLAAVPLPTSHLSRSTWAM